MTQISCPKCGDACVTWASSLTKTLMYECEKCHVIGGIRMDKVTHDAE